jgi:gliding motility-associated-like protein
MREADMHLKKCFLLLSCLLVFLLNNAAAQTCNGSLGDPIVNINFGAGSNFGPALSAGTTSSLQYQAATCPGDGFYSIVNYTSGCWASDVVWHTATDHTGNGNGYFMLVNASSQPSNFYIQTINGLCEGTTYQFAAWLVNMCSVMGINPNITFTIEKTDGSILATYNTNDIPIINPFTWTQYGVYFTTPVGVSTVVLRMRNNAPGGVGNDLGLDDITFRPSGPAIQTSIINHATDTVSLCADDTSTLQFTASVENCYASTAYQWQLSVDNGLNWTNIAGANTTAYTRLKTVSGNYLYRIIVAPSANITNTNCRVASNPIRINIHPLPATTAVNDGPKCAGDVVVLTVGGGKLYQWTGPNGFAASAAQDTIFNSGILNNGKYVVTVTDSVGCKKNDSTVVTVYAKPVAGFSTAAPACENSSGSFTNQSIDGGQPLQKWSWDFGDGTLSNSISPTHVFTKWGSYNVSLLVENDKGCKSVATIKQVAISPLPNPDFVLPAICLADPFATFINGSSIADSSQSQFVYAWNFGDKNATVANPNSSAIKSPQHSYTAIGVYPVRLTVTSKNGCEKDTLKNFTVNGSQPLAKFTIDAAVDFCSNKQVSLTDASTVNFGSISRVAIYWDYLNNPSVKTTDSISQAGKKYAHQYPEFGTPLTKQLQIRYVVYSGISCVNETTKLIEMKASPAVQFAALGNVCEEVTPFTITQAKEMNGLAGAGTHSGAGINAAGLFNPQAATPGNHVLRYTFLGSNNCTDFAEQTILVFAQPTVYAGPDRTMLKGGFITLDATATGNVLQYEWTPNNDIDNNKILGPTISPLVNTTYTLKVVSADGCKATDSIMVTVLEDIFVPTAFSPNGDGINDVWHIPFLNSYSGATVQVFNRYGQIVYQSTNNSIGWDGQFKGKPQPSGSYVWMLNTGSLRKLMVGTVMIVR